MISCYGSVVLFGMKFRYMEAEHKEIRDPEHQASAKQKGE